jgi:hypothetical protein
MLGVQALVDYFLSLYEALRHEFLVGSTFSAGTSQTNCFIFTGLKI